MKWTPCGRRRRWKNASRRSSCSSTSSSSSRSRRRRGHLGTTRTGRGSSRGSLILVVLWWAWGAYAWLSNDADPTTTCSGSRCSRRWPRCWSPRSRSRTRSGRDALVRHRLSRPCACSTWRTTCRARRPRATLGRLQLAPGVLLRVDAARRRRGLDGDARSVLWALAILIDLVAPVLFGIEGWRVEPGHFAERYGLFVIIALGESIVALGVDAGDERLDAGSDRRRTARRRGRRGAVVGLLRHRRDRRRAPAARRRLGRQAHRARLLHLPAPADGRRDRPVRGGRQEDAPHGARAPRHGARDRALRRRSRCTWPGTSASGCARSAPSARIAPWRRSPSWR